MSDTMTELSLTLDERHTADFEMIGNGGFAPLTGFQGSADWERVCSEMRTAAGEYWPIPITLAADLACEDGDTGGLKSAEGQPGGADEGREVLGARARPRARAGLRHRRRGPPSRPRDLRRGQPLHRRPDRGRRAAGPRGRLHAPLQDAGRAHSRLRGARLEEDRRLPDPQPDPPRPRVPDQGGAGDL